MLPGKGAIFHGLLTVLSPSVPIFQMIDLAFRHECESWFSLSLLICLLGLQPKPNKNQIPETIKSQNLPHINHTTCMYIFIVILSLKEKKKVNKRHAHDHLICLSNWMVKYVLPSLPHIKAKAADIKTYTYFILERPSQIVCSSHPMNHSMLKLTFEN